MSGVLLNRRSYFLAGCQMRLSSVPCHGAFPALASTPARKRERGGGVHSADKMEVAIWRNVNSDIPSPLPYSVRNKSPLPPILQRRRSYNDVSTRWWGPLRPSWCPTSQSSFRCFTLLYFRFFASVHRKHFIRAGRSGTAALRFSSRILETLFSRNLWFCSLFFLL